MGEMKLILVHRLLLLLPLSLVVALCYLRLCCVSLIVLHESSAAVLFRLNGLLCIIISHPGMCSSLKQNPTQLAVEDLYPNRSSP